MENFINYISSLNEKTQNNHIRNIQKIEDLMGRIDIDQKTFLNNLEKNPSAKIFSLFIYDFFFDINTLLIRCIHSYINIKIVKNYLLNLGLIAGLATLDFLLC